MDSAEQLAHALPNELLNRPTRGRLTRILQYEVQFTLLPTV